MALIPKRSVSNAIISLVTKYPGYEAHSGTPDDTESYNLLLKSLREQLDDLGEKTGKFYGLTAGELYCLPMTCLPRIPFLSKTISFGLDYGTSLTTDRPQLFLVAPRT